MESDNFIIFYEFTKVKIRTFSTRNLSVKSFFFLQFRKEILNVARYRHNVNQ
jgi:hypothetical protein